MKHPQPFSAKYRQFKSLSKKINHLISTGRFFRLSKKEQNKLIQKLQGLYLKLKGVFSTQALKRVLASAALLLGFEIAGQSQVFAPPVTDTFGLIKKATEFRFPNLVDLDGDGDFDLLTGEYKGAFKYYENIGNAQSPEFSTEMVNPFNLDSVYYVNFPVTGDLDDDGDYDILSVGYYGSTQYFENVGDAQNPDFVSRGINPFGIITGYSVYGEYFYMPSLVDLDNDGDLDLVVGGAYYHQIYYENTGTPGAPNFASPKKNTFGLTEDSTCYLTSQVFADFDNDGDYDMVTAAFTYDYYVNGYNYSYSSGVFKYFENIGTPTSPVFESSTGSKFAVDTVKSIIPVGLTVADLDNDGDIDMVFGGFNYDYNTYESGTSLYYIENLQNASGIANKINIEFSITPNPSSDYLNISVSNAEGEITPESLELVNINGTVVLTQRYTNGLTRLNIKSLPAGNYFLIARNAGKAIGTQKVVIAK